MKPRPRRDSSQNEVKFELTPMIDVTFLILVFFMCTLRFKTLDHKLESYLPTDEGLTSSSHQVLDSIPELSLVVPSEDWSLTPNQRRVRIQSEGGRRFGMIVPGEPGAVVRYEPAGVEDQVRTWLRSCREAAQGRGKIRVDARSSHAAVMGALDLFQAEKFAEVSYTGMPSGLLADLSAGRLH